MEAFKLDRNLAHLAVLQRIELITSFQKKVRKLFGRYLFSKIFSKYMLDVDYSREDLVNKYPEARTFPQITQDGNYIGGFTELNAHLNK